jgi:hypothetical protein
MEDEFPIALAEGNTPAAAAKDGDILRVRVETPAPPGFLRSHWKGNDHGIPPFPIPSIGTQP